MSDRDPGESIGDELLTLLVSAPHDVRQAASRCLQGITLRSRTTVSRQATVPVATEQWATIRYDAQLGEHWHRLLLSLRSSADALLGMHESGGAQRGRRSGLELARAAETLEEASLCVARFQPLSESEGRPGDALAVADGAHLLASLVLGFMADSDATELTALPRVLSATEQALQRLYDLPDPELPQTQVSDVWAALYGLSSFPGGSATGGAGRLLESATLPLPEITRRVVVALRHLVPPNADDIPSVTGHPFLLLSAPAPFHAHNAALWTRQAVERSWRDSPDACVSAIVQEMHRERELYAAHNLFVDAGHSLQRRMQAEDKDAVGALAAQRYGIAAEGWGKSMAKTILRLHGESVQEKVTLRPVLQRLPNLQDPVAQGLYDLVIVEWRNAISHLNVGWDSMIERLVLEDAPTELEVVLHNISALYSYHVGFDAGIAIAKQADPQLRSAIDAAAGSWDRGPILEVLAAEVCGYLQMGIIKVRQDKDEVSLVIREYVPDSVSKAQSALKAIRPQAPSIRRWFLETVDGLVRINLS